MKRVLLAVVVFGVVLFFALPCDAQEPSPTPEATEPASEPKIAPVMKGDVAPFTGLLVPEKRYAELVSAELTSESQAIKLEVKGKEAEALEAMYQKKLEAASAPTPWYETPSFNRWLGFGLGVVVTALAVYGGARLAEAINHDGGTTR